MSEIQQNRYDSLLRRVCDLKGPGSKVAWSVGDLLPVLDVERVPPELLVLGGSRKAIGRVVLNAGGALNFGHAFLRNNDDSGMIGRLEQMIIWSDTAQRVVVGPTTNSDIASGTRAFTDTRLFGEGTALVTQGNNNLLVIGADFGRIALNGVDSVIWEVPSGISVIGPGTAFMVSNGTANTNLHITFLWVERQAEPSELDL